MDDLVKQLREVDGGKLDFTDTPNWLRLKAADRIEQLCTARNDALEEAAGLANKPASEGGLAKSMAFFADVADYKSYKQGVSDYFDAISALKEA